MEDYMVKTSLPDSKACMYSFSTGSPSYKLSGLSVRESSLAMRSAIATQNQFSIQTSGDTPHLKFWNVTSFQCQEHLVSASCTSPLLPRAQTSCMVPCYHVHRHPALTPATTCTDYFEKRKIPLLKSAQPIKIGQFW